MRFRHTLHTDPFAPDSDDMTESRVIVCRTMRDRHNRVQWCPSDCETSTDESKDTSAAGRC